MSALHHHATAHFSCWTQQSSSAASAGRLSEPVDPGSPPECVFSARCCRAAWCGGACRWTCRSRAPRSSCRPAPCPASTSPPSASWTSSWPGSRRTPGAALLSSPLPNNPSQLLALSAGLSQGSCLSCEHIAQLMPGRTRERISGCYCGVAQRPRGAVAAAGHAGAGRGGRGHAPGAAPPGVRLRAGHHEPAGAACFHTSAPSMAASLNQPTKMPKLHFACCSRGFCDALYNASAEGLTLISASL
jgi:hypothetical protein